MNRVEIIKLRSPLKASILLKEILAPMVKADQSGLIKIKIYRHATLESDLSVHLHWEADGPEQNGSALGLRLAQALKEFGLIDHSLWIEEKDSKINPERSRKR
ncbi:MAG: hypothetical protein EHM27_04535 [Deltaproteobacteria bacterium]|nr:MAG: hypothetical protein EHM27_04535 [Deltaproteobacteria bacterium]